MKASLHRSLEAKLLASINDPADSESDDDEGREHEQAATTVSTPRADNAAKRKKGGRTPKGADDGASTRPSTVVYLGHLPAGFEEREIAVFLNQFGSVRRCRVSRSTKTGRSRGYAFVDFADAEVTAIVAKTMGGYFLLEKRLVCHILPQDKVHDLLFARPKRVQSKADRQKRARDEQGNQRRSAGALKEITAKLVRREEKKRAKLAALEIDYDFPGYAGISPSASKAGGKSSKKKKRETSDGGEEEGENNPNEAKAAASQKKRRKKSNNSSTVGESGKEREEATTADDGNDATTAESLKKQKKKNSKTSVEGGEEDENNAEEAKTPASKKKRKKKSKKSSSVAEGGEEGEKESTTRDENDATAATAESSKKKKKKNTTTKTPKKAKTPKNTQ